jgi:hypothetical protein
MMTATAGRLWRYNYAILLGTGYWVLVVPIAASQVVTLWMMAMAVAFGQVPATHIAELMTPILGAFLVAHSMAPEYRSGIGTVLACKPVSLHRVVTIRVGLAMLAAVCLTFITLFLCSVGVKPIRIGPPLAASLPSLWFLSLLALTFATVFRNSLAGFAVAAGIWSLDVAIGYAIHPLLSLQGYFALLDTDPLAEMWLAGKVTLLVAGAVLLWVHGRLLHRVSRPPERGDILKIVATVGVVMVAYCVTGAATTVSYAYAHRGKLRQPDAVWLRRQLSVYGPVPVASFFGPAFAAYVYDPAAGGKSPAEVRLAHLQQALARWPGSIWADGIAYALASEQEIVDPSAAARAYLTVADRYGGSPFAPKALGRIVSLTPNSATPDEGLLAARRLLADYPRREECERAAALLKQHFPGRVPPEEMLRAAQIAADVGPRFARPGWLLLVAQLQARLGRPAEAIATAEQARSLVLQFHEINLHAPVGTTDISQHLPQIDAALVGAEKLLDELKGKQ